MTPLYIGVYRIPSSRPLRTMLLLSFFLIQTIDGVAAGHGEICVSRPIPTRANEASENLPRVVPASEITGFLGFCRLMSEIARFMVVS